MLFLLLLIGTIQFTNAEFNFNLIKDYLKENHLKICLLLSCEGIDSNFELFKKIQSENVWTNIVDISNGTDSIDMDKTFQYRSAHVAVVIDLECSSTSELLNEISKRIWFHQRYFWLMFSPDFQWAYQHLINQNINLDAEITLVIPMDKQRFNHL